MYSIMRDVIVFLAQCSATAQKTQVTQPYRNAVCLQRSYSRFD